MARLFLVASYYAMIVVALESSGGPGVPTNFCGDCPRCLAFDCREHSRRVSSAGIFRRLTGCSSPSSPSGSTSPTWIPVFASKPGLLLVASGRAAGQRQDHAVRAYPRTRSPPSAASSPPTSPPSPRGREDQVRLLLFTTKRPSKRREIEAGDFYEHARVHSIPLRRSQKRGPGKARRRQRPCLRERRRPRRRHLLPAAENRPQLHGAAPSVFLMPPGHARSSKRRLRGAQRTTRPRSSAVSEWPSTR